MSILAMPELGFGGRGASCIYNPTNILEHFKSQELPSNIPEYFKSQLSTGRVSNTSIHQTVSKIFGEEN